VEQRCDDPDFLNHPSRVRFDAFVGVSEQTEAIEQRFDPAVSLVVGNSVEACDVAELFPGG